MLFYKRSNVDTKSQTERIEKLNRYWNMKQDEGGCYLRNIPAFYQKKAKEHAALIPEEERHKGAIDLGCGTCRLTKEFDRFVRVDCALDFSKTMLATAKKECIPNHITLSNEDVFTYLLSSSHPNWVTTDALNIYFSPREIQKLIEIFVSNRVAQTLSLFDCIDHLRWYIPFAKSTYHKQEQLEILHRHSRLTQPIVNFLRFLYFLGLIVYPVDYGKLYPRAYGYLPSFWWKLAKKHNLHINIVSSLLSAAQYHVLLRKTPFPVKETT